MIRNPVVAGQFYPDKAKELKKAIENSFLHKFGPGKLPEKRGKKRIRGVISPHAGYQFSGPCTAHVYKEIAESIFPDVYLVIGPNHTGLGKSSVSYEDYETPFGIVKTDQEMAKLIAKETKVIGDAHSHLNEHSVEVQIPFLQFVSDDKIDQLRIVPIVLSGEIDMPKFGKDLAKVIKNSKKNVVIIVSSDMTHFGWNYGYIPFDDNIKENLYKMDSETIDLIKKGDAKGFEKRLDDIKGTVCGKLPIIMLLNAVKSKDIKLLKYYTSGDIIGDYTNAVGYAAIVLK